jgi:hypothetical protein
MPTSLPASHTGRQLALPFSSFLAAAASVSFACRHAVGFMNCLASICYPSIKPVANAESTSETFSRLTVA